MRNITGPLVKMMIFTVVTLLVTTALGMIIVSGTGSGPVSSYSAKFDDASGLGTGDEVRISGVKVGQVTSVEFDDGHAVVDFEIRSARTLPTDAEAAVKYLNLIGQRYLSLKADLSGSQDVLAPGGTIPTERTKPALNLTELFGGFRPLFQALSPKEVNKLSLEIIKVLQGQQGTVESLLAHTASLTSTIAKKDEVIGRVIDNLNHVLGTVNARSPQLSELITALQQLVSGLAEQRRPVGEAVSALDELTRTTGGLLEQARPPLRKDIAALKDLSKGMSDDIPQMEAHLKTLPNRLGSLTRTVSYGSWFNFFMCNMSGTVGIDELNIEVPILPLPATEMPERCYAP